MKGSTLLDTASEPDCLLTNKVDFGGADFLPGWGRAGGWQAHLVLEGSRAAADDVDGFQVGGAGAGWGGGRQTAGGAGAAQGGCRRLTGSSRAGGQSLSGQTGLGGRNGFPQFGVKLHNLKKKFKHFGASYQTNQS